MLSRACIPAHHRRHSVQNYLALLCSLQKPVNVCWLWFRHSRLLRLIFFCFTKLHRNGVKQSAENKLHDTERWETRNNNSYLLSYSTSFICSACDSDPCFENTLTDIFQNHLTSSFFSPLPTYRSTCSRHLVETKFNIPSSFRIYFVVLW